MAKEFPNRGQAQPQLKKMVGEGLSTNRILKTLREAGLGYTYKHLANDIQKYKSYARAADVGKFLRKDYFPTKAALVEAWGDQKRNYLHRINFSFLDKTTGETTHMKYTFGTDERLNRGDAEEMAFNIVAERLDHYQSEIVKYGYQYTIYKKGMF